MNETDSRVVAGTDAVPIAESTAALRRCAAAAARARMGILASRRPDRLAELSTALDEISTWTHRRIETPDGPMLSIAIAALEDLARTIPEERSTVRRLHDTLRLLERLAQRRLRAHAA